MARWAFAVLGVLALSTACGDDADNDDCLCPAMQSPDATTPSPGPTPMLVRVQPGKTLTADPGNGAGVFVQYAPGGQWTVWWTCDTKITSRTCNFDVALSVAKGKIAKLAGFDGYELTAGTEFEDAGTGNGSEDATEDAFQDGTEDVIDSGPVDASVNASPASRFDLSSSVTSEARGITFTTTPGATLEIAASLNGTTDGNLFFFVDDGKIKDGYQGTLSDPLDFEPTSP